MLFLIFVMKVVGFSIFLFRNTTVIIVLDNTNRIIVLSSFVITITFKKVYL